MKLLFFISSLQCGGAQRVCVMLCDYWAQAGWNVTLATFEDPSEPSFFKPGPGVRHVKLGLAGASTGILRGVFANFRRLRRLRRFLIDQRPEVILSFIDETNVLTLLAARGTGIPVVVSERTDPARHAIPRPWSILRRITYPWAEAIVLQTQGAASRVPSSWTPRIAVVPNPAPKGVARSEGGMASGGMRRIVGLGRLERAKGFDMLIRAFASAAAERQEWELTILGEGPERHALNAEIARSGIAPRISLPGLTTDAMDRLSRADIFVLSSRYEGFPNALCEAMACGLPVVAFDCQSGPAEIVRDGVDGWLVRADDERALSQAMARLMADPEARRRMGARAADVSDRFSIERIAGLWERVLTGRAA